MSANVNTNFLKSNVKIRTNTSFNKRKTKTSSIKRKSYHNPEVEKRNLKSLKMYTTDKDSDIYEYDKLPSIIEGNYTYDYNILNIHNLILKRFKMLKIKNSNILNNKLEIEQENIKKRQKIVDRIASNKNIEKILHELEKLKNNIDYNEYLDKSSKFIKEYIKLGPIVKVISFTKNNRDNDVLCPEDDETQIIRHRLIFEYLEIARKYIQINLIRIIPNTNCCSGCKIDFDECPMETDVQGLYYCTNCGLEIIMISKTPFYKDGNRVNSSRNNYEDRANFEKVILRYQGKQPNKPGKELYERLDEYFISKNLPSSKEVKAKPLINDKRPGTSRQLMYKALKDLGYSSYYDDINLICNVFWGWKLPNIAHLEDQIIKDYDISQRVYDNLPNKDGRKSSLNSQWRLYKHLCRLDWPCKSKDFKIPTTPDILEFHTMKWAEICAILNWDNK